MRVIMLLMGLMFDFEGLFHASAWRLEWFDRADKAIPVVALEQHEGRRCQLQRSVRVCHTILQVDQTFPLTDNCHKKVQRLLTSGNLYLKCFAIKWHYAILNRHNIAFLDFHASPDITLLYLCSVCSCVHVHFTWCNKVNAIKLLLISTGTISVPSGPSPEDGDTPTQLHQGNCLQNKHSSRGLKGPSSKWILNCLLWYSGLNWWCVGSCLSVRVLWCGAAAKTSCKSWIHLHWYWSLVFLWSPQTGCSHLQHNFNTKYKFWYNVCEFIGSCYYIFICTYCKKYKYANILYKYIYMHFKSFLCPKLCLSLTIKKKIE